MIYKYNNFSLAVGAVRLICANTNRRSINHSNSSHMKKTGTVFKWMRSRIFHKMPLQSQVNHRRRLFLLGRSQKRVLQSQIGSTFIKNRKLLNQGVQTLSVFVIFFFGNGTNN